MLLLSATSAFTERHNRLLPLFLPSPPPLSAPSTPPHLFVKGQHRGESSGPHRPPLPGPTDPTPQSSSTLEPRARKLNQRRASESSRPLKTIHCLHKASKHCSRSICNTVRGVAHYCLSPASLCFFCAADTRI